VRPQISVVIPTFNRTAILRRSLDCLQAQTVASNRFEIVVVDDACEQPVEPELSSVYRHSGLNLRWARIEENNLSRARNVGIRAASGELILFLGDDIFALPRLLETHLEAHAARPDAPIAVLGRIDPDPLLQQTAFERFFDPFGFTRLRGDQLLGSRHFWTNNVSLNTEFLRRHGMFDEDLPDANHEDIELGYRLELAGLRVFYRDRVVGYHHHPYTLASACRLAYRRGVAYHVLRRKVPEGVFRESIGIFSWRNSPRAVVHGVARMLLFNAWSVAFWQRWLERDKESRGRRFFYWKLLDYHLNEGYRDGRAGAATA